MDPCKEADEKAPLLHGRKSRRKAQRTQQLYTQASCGPGPEPSRESSNPISRCLSWCCTLCTERQDSPESESVLKHEDVHEPESVSEPESEPEPSPEPPPVPVLLLQPEPVPSPQLEEKPSSNNFQTCSPDNVISDDCWEVIWSKQDDYSDLKHWLWETFEDLDSRELKYFQWFLNTADESKHGFKPIKKSRLEHADRLDTIDLMVQMYTSKAREVAEKILIKVTNKKEKPLHEPVLQDTPAYPALTEKELAIMLNDFIKKVSRENLTQVLEALVTDSVLNDLDRKLVLEENHTRVNKASCFVDIVTEKGDEACKKMINHLQVINPALTSELSLASGPSAQEDDIQNRECWNFPERTRKLQLASPQWAATSGMVDSESFHVSLEGSTYEDDIQDKTCRSFPKRNRRLHLAVPGTVVSGSFQVGLEGSRYEEGGPSTSFDDSGVSAAPSDLHEVLQKCEQNFKSELKNKLQRLFEGNTFHGHPPSLNEIHTKLHILEGETAEVADNHEFGQMESPHRNPDGTETTIRPEDIFKVQPGRNEPNRTLITRGVAGAGKTILTQRVTLDWAEEKANQDIQLLFLFTFRELNVLKERKFSLVELLHHFFSETKEIGRFEEFQVVFIFDGLDECRLPLNFHSNVTLTDITESTSVDVLLTNLISGNLLPSAHLWITTRPAAANQIPPHCVGMVTEVRGFTDEQKEEYFSKRLGDGEQAKRIISHIKKSRSLHIMCHIPVFCWITATVLQDLMKTRKYGELPKTLTEMYIHFLVVQAKQKMVTVGADETYPYWTPETREMIESLGKLAFEQMQKGNLIFYESDLKECGIDITGATVCSGVFRQFFRQEKGLYQDKVLCFIHLSAQEFLAALHVHLTFISTGINLLGEHTYSETSETREDESADLYCKAVDTALQSTNGHMDLFLRFLLGLSLQTNQILLRGLLIQMQSNSKTKQEVVKYIKEKISENLSAEKSISLIHCLSELEDPYLEEEIQKYISSKTVSTEDLSLTQWLALIFIMFDQKKYNLQPIFCTFDKDLLSNRHLPKSKSDALLSVLDPLSSTLSNNDLVDSGLKVLGVDVKSLPSNLHFLRESFSSKYQFNILMHYIVHQNPDLKAKLDILDHIKIVAHQIGRADFINTGLTRLAISRILTWTTEPNPDIRKLARVVLIALFEVNPQEFTMLVAVLPKTFQNGARMVLHNHLKNRSSGLSTASPACTPPHQRLMRSRSLTRCCHDDLHPSMLGFDSDDIPNLRFRSKDDLMVVQRLHRKVKGAESDIGELSIHTCMEPKQLRDSDRRKELDQYVKNVLVELQKGQAEEGSPKELYRARLELMKIVVQEDSLVVWVEHFELMLLVLLQTMQDKDHKIRELTLQALKAMLKSQPARFEKYTELTIVKTLEACSNSNRAVEWTVKEVASMLAASLPPKKCTKVLCPIMLTADYPVVLAAIRMQKKVVQRLDKELLLQLLPDIMPGVLQGCGHDISSVRKRSIFCLVDIHAVIGEELNPYLTKLTSAKMKLLNLYIKRSKTVDNSSSSDH